MPRLITLNSQNIVSSQYSNVLQYNFPTNTSFKQGDYIALQGVNLYYSWFNISAALNNNKIRYYWVSQVAGVNTYITVDLTIPDGLYTTDTLNKFLQYSMIQNNHYIIDTVTGDFIYYLTIETNFTYYKNQINSFPIPTFPLPAGLAQPIGAPVLPAVSEGPRLEFTSSLATQFGYVQSISYPTAPVLTRTSVLSPNIPQISLQNNIVVRCSLVESKFASIIKDIIFSFVPKSAFATFLNLDTSELIWNSIKPGYYSSFRVEFISDNYEPLRVIDSNMLLTFIVWNEREDGKLKVISKTT